MNTDHLIEKVASSNIRFNPQLLDVVRRVRQTGLHKTAAALHGVSGEMSLKTAMHILGARLVLERRQNQKIAAALNALDNL